MTSEIENPRYIQLSSDDLMWFYDGTQYDFTSLLEDTPKWMSEHVKCKSAFNYYLLQFSSSNPDDKSFVFSNICGTSVIQIEGYHGLREPVFGTPGPGELWANFDDILIQQMGGSQEIEFFFLEHEDQGFIHFQLGEDKDFVGAYVSAIVADPDGYVKWLQNPVIQRLPRVAYCVNPDGSQSQVSMDCFKILPITPIEPTPAPVPTPPVTGLSILYENINPPSLRRSHRREQRELHDDPPPVPTTVEYACSANVANIDSGSTGSGDLIMNITTVTVKAYCRDAEGNPCE